MTNTVPECAFLSRKKEMLNLHFENFQLYTNSQENDNLIYENSTSLCSAWPRKQISSGDAFVDVSSTIVQKSMDNVVDLLCNDILGFHFSTQWNMPNKMFHCFFQKRIHKQQWMAIDMEKRLNNTFNISS